MPITLPPDHAASGAESCGQIKVSSSSKAAIAAGNAPATISHEPSSPNSPIHESPSSASDGKTPISVKMPRAIGAS